MKHTIPAGLSLYLDMVRFLAAMAVVLHHTWPLIFPGLPLPWPGHSAVVVFFVLSGYVITHASRPELGLREYAQHRMARILPVAIVAMLLSVAISQLSVSSSVPNSGVMVFSWQSLSLNMLFLAQSWMDVSPSYNPPFWSLNYEVWYYIIFGTWVYTKNRVLTLLAVTIAGPKILLLLPVWLLGVALYKWTPMLGRRQAAHIFIASILVGLAFVWFDVAVHIREAMKIIWPVAMKLSGGSGLFVGDFLLGLIVAANFMAAASLDMRILFRFKTPIRYLSSFTFSTYVFHMPLVILIWNGLDVHNASAFYALLALLILVLGQITERQAKFYRSPLQWRIPTSIKSAEV